MTNMTPSPELVERLRKVADDDEAKARMGCDALTIGERATIREAATHLEEVVPDSEAMRLVGNWLAEDVDFYDNLPANYETRKAIRAVFAALTLFEVRRS